MANVLVVAESRGGELRSVALEVATAARKLADGTGGEVHALVFGMTRGVPSVALSYARKVRGFMREMESEQWTVEVEQRTPPPDEIGTKLRLLWASRGAERARLRAQADRVRVRAVKDADAIAAVLRGDRAA